MNSIPNVTRRAGGKVPTTAVTNELADAINGILPTIKQGQPEPKPISGAGGEQFCTLANATGYAGGNGTYCGFIYDVYDYGANTSTGTALATGVTLVGNGNRIAPWTMVAASTGRYIKQNGTLILTHAGERAAGYKDCPDPPP